MHALMLSDYTFSLRSHIRAQSPDYPSLTSLTALAVHACIRAHAYMLLQILARQWARYSPHSVVAAPIEAL